MKVETEIFTFASARVVVKTSNLVIAPGICAKMRTRNEITFPLLTIKSASQQFSPKTVQDKKIENCQTLSQ